MTPGGLWWKPAPCEASYRFSVTLVSSRTVSSVMSASSWRDMSNSAAWYSCPLRTLPFGVFDCWKNNWHFNHVVNRCE